MYSEPELFNRYPAKVSEKRLKKEAKIIVMTYVANLAHIKQIPSKKVSNNASPN